LYDIEGMNETSKFEDLICIECGASFPYDRSEILNTLDPLVEAGECLHDVYCDSCGELITIKFDLVAEVIPYDEPYEPDEEDLDD
jgi:hypothetical protein